MEELIRFDCPGCGRPLDTPADTAGLEGRCPACKTRFLIPGTPDPSHFPAIDADWLEDQPKPGTASSSTMKLDLDEPSVPPPAPPRRFRIRRGS